MVLLALANIRSVAFHDNRTKSDSNRSRANLRKIFSLARRAAGNYHMKKKRRIFILMLASVLLVVVFSVKWREPRYHWKPLSTWLAAYGAGPGNYQPSPKVDN